MRKSQLLTFILSLTFLISCSSVPVQATYTDSVNEIQLEAPVLLRASGGFSTSVPANTLKSAGSTFPLEIGETITINAHYSPATANVDFGFIAPDGLFYSVSASGGYINVTIEVTQHGNYKFAIRNNSAYTISAFGIVNY